MRADIGCRSTEAVAEIGDDLTDCGARAIRSELKIPRLGLRIQSTSRAISRLTANSMFFLIVGEPTAQKVVIKIVVDILAIAAGAEVLR